MDRDEEDKADRRIAWVADYRVFVGVLGAIGGMIGFFVSWNPIPVLMAAACAASAIWWNPVRKKYAGRNLDRRNEDFNQPW